MAISHMHKSCIHTTLYHMAMTHNTLWPCHNLSYMDNIVTIFHNMLCPYHHIACGFQHVSDPDTSPLPSDCDHPQARVCPRGCCRHWSSWRRPSSRSARVRRGARWPSCSPSPCRWPTGWPRGTARDPLMPPPPTAPDLF